MLADLMARALIVGSLLLALVPSGLWLRRAFIAYVRETTELHADVPPSAPPVGDAALPGLREITWTLASGATQRAWYVPGSQRALVVFAHGSPGDRASLLPEARALIAHGSGALLLDFPGYGASEGERTWGASYRESLARALDFAAAQPEVDPARIGGFGFSMGTCVLAQLAAERLDEAAKAPASPRFAALALRGAFTTLEQQLHAQFQSTWPGIASIAVWTARRHGVALDELDARPAVRALRGQPLLFLTGENDRATPPFMAHDLAKSMESASVWVIPQAGHADMPNASQDAYNSRIVGFFRRYLGLE